MLNLKQLTVFFIFLLMTNFSFSQLGFSHEIGIIAGPVEFRSDYGTRNSAETNFGNMGYGIGIVHYINFAYRADCNCYSADTYFNDHFKLRSEISYNYTKLEHHGEYVDPSQTSLDAQRLRDHYGEAKNLDIGMQLEYFPRSIRAFEAFRYSFAPFVSLGVHYTNFSPTVSTDFGDKSPTNPNNFYTPWMTNPLGVSFEDVINVEGGSTWSVVASVGTRYKLNNVSDLMVDLRWQYFGEDYIDGLNHKLDYNKYNDWLIWLNFGYIYYLD